MRTSVRVFVLLALYACALALSDDQGPLAKIGQGKLLGKWQLTHRGRKYASFEGVPYARPPLGKYRFREPQKAEPWVGIWDATKQGSLCSAIDPFVGGENDLVGNEDCLFVNVYSPNLDEKANLPVLVHIHGGAFMFGTGNKFMPTFLLDKDFVYVSLNYRLNVFGFLSTEDEVVPGNMGLKDQSAALHWIKENIKAFGGDPNLVTITGLSAGGASVHYQMLSPLSRGTFQRAISFSGTSLCPWTLTVNPLQKAQMFAKRVGCFFKENERMVECLKQRPTFALLNALKMFDLWKVNLFSAFTPVVEPQTTKNAFLKKLPYKAVQDGDFAQVPWIASITSEEGLYPSGEMTTDEILKDLDDHWETLAPYIFVFNDTLPKSKHVEAAKKIKDYYTNGAPISKKTFSKLTRALGDRHFNMDVQKAVRLQLKKSENPIYFYYFQYRGPQSLSDEMSHSTENYGVSHGDDVFYAFHSPYINPALNKETLAMSDLLINIMHSFAVTGKPEVPGVKWEPVDSSKQMKLLDIASPTDYKMKIVNDLGNEALWDAIPFKENEKVRSLKTEL